MINKNCKNKEKKCPHSPTLYFLQMVTLMTFYSHTNTKAVTVITFYCHSNTKAVTLMTFY